MLIPLIGKIEDELQLCDEETREFVENGNYSPADLDEFRDHWHRSLVNIYAMAPVVEFICEKMHVLIAKYHLEVFEQSACIFDDNDVGPACSYFQFLLFLLKHESHNKITARLFEYSSFSPQNFFLVANASVAKLAMMCDVLLSFGDRSSDNDQVTMLKRLSLLQQFSFDFIPVYDDLDGSCSDYFRYLNPQTEPNELRLIEIGEFKANDRDIATKSTLELIRQGMALLPRTEWAQLIYACRKAVASRQNNIEERCELVSLHATQAALHRRWISYIWVDEGTERMNIVGINRIIGECQRAYYIVLPDLLQKYPELTDAAALYFLIRLGSCQSSFLQFLSEKEVVLSYLDSKSEDMLNSVVYLLENHQKFSCITPICMSALPRYLEKWNRKNSHIECQYAILRIMNILLDENRHQFTAELMERTELLNSLLAMTATNLAPRDYIHTQLCKGLLMAATKLLNLDDSPVAVEVSYNPSNLNTICGAVKVKELQYTAIKCLCNLLDADLLCYTAVQNENLWPSIVAVTEPFALAQLYSSLGTNDKGKAIISEYDLTPKLLNSAFYCCFHGEDKYSLAFYTCLTDAVTRIPDTLEQFASKVPEFLQRVLNRLDDSPSEFNLQTKSRIAGRRSSLTSLLHHFLLFLGSLVHREQVRVKLKDGQGFELLVRILSHPALPFDFGADLRHKVFFNALFNELFLTENALPILDNLLNGLAAALKGDPTDPTCLKKIIVYKEVLMSMKFMKTEAFGMQVVPYLLFHKSFRYILENLAQFILKLITIEADIVAGPEKCAICVNSVTHDSPHFPIYQHTIWSESEKSTDECLDLHARTWLNRFAYTGLKDFSCTLSEFYACACSARYLVPKVFALSIWATSCIRALRSIPLKTTRDRYVLLIWLEQFMYKLTTDCVGIDFRIHGGIQACMETYVRLYTECESKEPMRVLLYGIERNLFKDATELLEAQFSSRVVQGFEQVDDSPHQYHDIDRVTDAGLLASRMCALEYLLEQLTIHHVPILPGWRVLTQETDNCLAPHVNVVKLVTTNWMDILADQDSSGLRHGAAMLVDILSLFMVFEERLIMDFVAKLHSFSDPASLALLAAITTARNATDLKKCAIQSSTPLENIISSLSSQNCLAVLSAAQIIVKLPQEILHSVIPSIPNISQLLLCCDDPLTIAHLCELYSVVCLVSGHVPLLREVKAFSTSFFHLFEANNYDFDCALACTSLIDLYRSIFETDETMLRGYFGHILGSQITWEDTSSLELKLKDCSKRSHSVIQKVVESNSLIDDATGRVYNRKDIQEVYDLSDHEPLKLSEYSCEFLNYCMGELIIRGPGFYAACLDLIRQEEEYNDFYFRTKLVTLIDDNKCGDDAESSVINSWEKFRQVYFAYRVYMETLCTGILMNEAFTNAIIANERFNDLISAILSFYLCPRIFNPNGRPLCERSQTEFIERILKCNKAYVLEAVFAAFNAAVINSKDESARTRIIGGIFYVLVAYMRGENASPHSEIFGDCLKQSGIIEACESHVCPKYVVSLDDCDPIEHIMGNFHLLYDRYAARQADMIANAKKEEEEAREGEAKTGEQTQTDTCLVVAVEVNGSHASVVRANSNSSTYGQDNQSGNVDEARRGINGPQNDRAITRDDVTNSELDLIAAANNGDDNDDDNDDDDDAYSYYSDIDYESGIEGAAREEPFNHESINDTMAINIIWEGEWNFHFTQRHDHGNRTLEATYTYDPRSSIRDYFLLLPRDEFLATRGLAIGPATPTGKRLHIMTSWVKRPPLQVFNSTFVGYGGRYIGYSKADDCQIITRLWSIFKHAHLAPINWAAVPRVDRSKISGIDKRMKKNEKKASNENIIKVDYYDRAVAKALELLEDSKLLESWGFDVQELEALPDEMRLEALISQLTINCGGEMGLIDFLQSLDEPLQSEIAMDACLDGAINSNELEYVYAAQFNSTDSIDHALEARPPKHIAPKLSTDIFQRLGLIFSFIRTGFDFSRRLLLDERDSSYLLALLADGLGDGQSSFNTHLVSRTLEAIDVGSKKGTIFWPKLLDMLHSPKIIRVKANLSKLLDIVASNIKLVKVNSLDNSIIQKVLSIFWSEHLSKQSQCSVKDLIANLTSEGYLSSHYLQELVRTQLERQIDICTSTVKNGDYSGASFNGIQRVLSRIVSQRLCDLDEKLETVVAKATKLGQIVSSAFKESEDHISSARILRFYLFLVVVTPDARPALLTFIRENRRAANNIISQDQDLLVQCIQNLRGNYDLLDYNTKVAAIYRFTPKLGNNEVHIILRRDYLLEDAFKKLFRLGTKEFARSVISIEFMGEMGQDAGGLLREMFTLFGRSLHVTKFGLFTEMTGGGTGKVYHPHPQSLADPSNAELYEFLGMMMGKAVQSKSTMDCSLSKVVYEAIVSRPDEMHLSLTELQQYDYELANSLRWILDNDITDVLMETFVSKSTAFGELETIELKPDGRNIFVDDSNKQEYVELLVRQLLYKTVKVQIDSICKGFWSVVPHFIAKLFSATELEALVCGDEEIDIELWKANTKYDGFTIESSVIKWFWQAIKAMSNRDRMSVLLFATGSSKVSSLGFTQGGVGTQGIRFTISCSYDTFSSSKLPTASTCLSTLNLPKYSNYDELRLSLQKAIEYGSLGFGFG